MTRFTKEKTNIALTKYEKGSLIIFNIILSHSNLESIQY